jgi:mono/diheme cytochrome c family protein
MVRFTRPLYTGFLLAALLSSAAVLAAQQTTTATTTAPRRGGNPEAAALKNPVASTPESLAAGRRFYTQYCANCHGPVGKGDGTTAGADQPSDLTDGVWDYGGSDGEIFAVIHDGLTGKDMGGYAGRISDNDTWNVVNFIRTLSRVPGQK